MHICESFYSNHFHVFGWNLHYKIPGANIWEDGAGMLVDGRS